MQCMKEGAHRVDKLIENWSDDCSIAEVICINGMVRRDECNEHEKWMYQPSVIGRFNKRTQIFFKVQTKLSVKELA